MGTSMVCTFNQVAPPGDGCQIVRRARWTASALIAPGPAGSVTVPGGSAGNVCQWPPALVMISPLLPVSTTAVAAEAPNDVEVTAAPFSGSGGESAQWPPLSVDQAASRRGARPLPAASSATVWCEVWVSLSTAMSCRARAAGIAGPAACQAPCVSAKMPAVPGGAQLPPSRGVPDGVNVAAGGGRRPPRRPGAGAGGGRLPGSGGRGGGAGAV